MPGLMVSLFQVTHHTTHAQSGTPSPRPPPRGATTKGLRQALQGHSQACILMLHFTHTLSQMEDSPRKEVCTQRV